MQSGTPSQLRSVPRCQSQMPNYLLALKWPPPSPSPSLSLIHASWPTTPPPMVISSPSVRRLHCRRRAANASNSILGIQWPSIALRPSHCSAPLSSGLFKEWSATQQLFTALLFRQNRFSNSPFYCGLTLHCENPIHSLQLFGV